MSNWWTLFTTKRLTLKKLKPVLSPMRKTKLSHDMLLKFSVWPFEVIEVKGYSTLNFDILTSYFFYLNLKRLLLTPKMSDRNLYYITNGSERLIYFSLLFFLEEAFLLQSIDNDAPRDFFCSHFKYLALLTAQLYWEVSKTEKAKASKKGEAF